MEARVRPTTGSHSDLVANKARRQRLGVKRNPVIEVVDNGPQPVPWGKGDSGFLVHYFYINLANCDIYDLHRY